MINFPPLQIFPFKIKTFLFSLLLAPLLRVIRRQLKILSGAKISRQNVLKLVGKTIFQLSVFPLPIACKTFPANKINYINSNNFFHLLKNLGKGNSSNFTKSMIFWINKFIKNSHLTNQLCHSLLFISVYFSRFKVANFDFGHLVIRPRTDHVLFRTVASSNNHENDYVSSCFYCWFICLGIALCLFPKRNFPEKCF